MSFPFTSWLRRMQVRLSGERTGSTGTAVRFKRRRGAPHPVYVPSLELEFPTKSGHRVKLYSVRSYSAGDTYPSEECRRLVL